MEILERSQVAKENTWALEDIFETEEKWNEAFEQFETEYKKIAEYQGRLNDPVVLFEYLKRSDELGLLLSKIYGYASMNYDVDTTNDHYQAMIGKVMLAYNEFAAVSSFDSAEILAYSDEEMEEAYKNVDGLELYRLAISRIRKNKAHILSSPEEKILAGSHVMSDSFDTVSAILRNSDMKFEDALNGEGKPMPVTNSSFTGYIHTEDCELRKNAFNSLYKSYDQLQNTLAALLNSQNQQLNFYAKTRGYQSALEASLSSHEVPVEVYQNLIDSVHKNMGSMYKYMKLRKKALQLDEMHWYDLYVPITASSTSKIEYKDACDTIVKAMAPLTEEYQQLLEEGFSHRWVDIYENKGKRAGAYSSGGHPHPYVLMNYQDDMDSMFTLAHEMGHSLHTYYSIKTQPAVYSNYVLFVAEVASTCNEVLLTHYLLQNCTDKKEKAAIITHFIESFRTTLFRQCMFAEFEKKISETSAQNTTLTATYLNETYAELNHLYYGDDVVFDDYCKLEWARIPHLYYDFYVYQYATSFAASVALANKILHEEGAVEHYLKFLSMGCSTDPISILKVAGVDMTTSAPIDSALAYFGELIDQLEELLVEE